MTTSPQDTQAVPVEEKCGLCEEDYCFCRDVASMDQWAHRSECELPLHQPKYPMKGGE